MRYAMRVSAVVGAVLAMACGSSTAPVAATPVAASIDGAWQASAGAFSSLTLTLATASDGTPSGSVVGDLANCAAGPSYSCHVSGSLTASSHGANSVTFTATFPASRSDATFTGQTMSDGTMVGTITEHLFGVATPVAPVAITFRR